MTTRLHVPDRHVPFLKELSRLPPDMIRGMIQELRRDQLNLNLDDFADLIAQRLSLDAPTSRGVVELLSSLYALRDGLGDVSELVSGLRAAMEESGNPDLQHEDWPAFEAVLTEAFSIDSALSLSAKALDVMTDHQRVFMTARVLTDLRPVFRFDVSEAPAAMVPVHTLKFIYRSEGVPREFYIAMDSRDLESLMETLQRALAKDKSLRSLAESANLGLLEVKP